MVDGALVETDTTITLALGADIYVSADGDLTYDTQKAFSDLAPGTSTTDTFSYVLQRGAEVFDLADPDTAPTADITAIVYATVDTGDTYFAESLGYAVAGAGDFDGDGVQDLVVTAPSSDTENDENTGAVYIIYGAAGSRPDMIELHDLTKATGIQIFGRDLYDRIGYSVAGVADINSDGFYDILIGAPDAGLSLNGEGQAYAIFGKSGRTHLEVEIAALDGSKGFVYSGGQSYADGGHDVAAAGDFNQDGIPDILISAIGYDYDYNDGRVDIIFGVENGADFPSAANGFNDGQVLFGPGTINGAFGYSISSAGDFNGDGLNDLLIGRPNYNSISNVYLILNDEDGIPDPSDFNTTDIPNQVHVFEKNRALHLRARCSRDC